MASLKSHIFRQDDVIQNGRRDFTGYIAGVLAHWSQMTHIGVTKLTIIGSDIGLSHGRHKAII